MIYIGVVGQIASGKSLLVNYLTEHFGFQSLSMSSIVHDELKKKAVKEFTRQTLQDIGDELRNKEGDDVLAKRISGNIKNLSSIINHPASIIIEGIRNPAEIKFFKENLNNFILIGVKARKELRYQRLLIRGKKWDPKTYGEFLKVDRRDLGVGQSNSGQQVRKCLNYCDYILINNKKMGDFKKEVQKLFIHKLFSGSSIIK